MKKTKNNRTIVTLALAAASFVIFIALAEIVLRYIFPIDVSTSFNHRIPHPVYGWVLEPSVSYLNKMPEDTVRVTYNSAGWRDVEHAIENHRGAYRILVLGDSFMEGYSVKLEDMFHRKIGYLARREGVNMEVINLGVGGYGTLQEYLVFREIGKHYKPDIVLLGFYLGNDLRNNSLSLESIVSTNSMKAKSRPFLDSSNEATWKITQVDYDGARRRYLAAKANKDKESFIQKLENQSALMQATLRAVNRTKTMIKKTGHAPSNRNASEAEKKKARRLAVYGPNYCQEHPEFTKAWVTTKRILNQLKNEVSSIEGELFVFTVPARREVVEKKIRNFQDRELICWKDAPSYDRLRGMLKELDIGYIDLLPSFRKIINDEKQNIFRRSDGHWNEKGHDIAARIVYSALKDRILFPSVETNHSPPNK